VNLSYEVTANESKAAGYEDFWCRQGIHFWSFTLPGTYNLTILVLEACLDRDMTWR
jgi:hypothetical protein